MPKAVLFSEPQADRIAAAVKTVEREYSTVRRNPAPSYKASANIPAVVIGSASAGQYRWRYTLVYGSSVRWDVGLHKWVPVTQKPTNDDPAQVFTPQECYAYNQSESNNTATAFGRGTLRTQGSGVLTPGPIPNGEPVTLLLRVSEFNGLPVFEFDTSNPVSAGCNP